MHPRLSGRGHWTGYEVPPIVKGSVIRVEVEHLPKPTARTKKTLWLWWSGEGEPDLDLCWRAYLRRFDIEHTFRSVKGTLGWTTPSVCTPEQADRWTWLVMAPYTEHRLARSLVDDLRLPWERLVCDGGFADFVHRSERRPVHRNPRPRDQDDPKEPENRPELVIPQSKRLRDQTVGV